MLMTTMANTVAVRGVPNKAEKNAAMPAMVAEMCIRDSYNPYEGFVTAGGIRQVWLRGRLSVAGGKVLAEEPAGRYMARGKNSL